MTPFLALTMTEKFEPMMRMLAARSGTTQRVVEDAVALLCSAVPHCGGVVVVVVVGLEYARKFPRLCLHLVGENEMPFPPFLARVASCGSEGIRQAGTLMFELLHVLESFERPRCDRNVYVVVDGGPVCYHALFVIVRRLPAGRQWRPAHGLNGLFVDSQ